MRRFLQKDALASGDTPNAGTEGQEVMLFNVSIATQGSQRFKSLACFSLMASDDGVSGPLC